MAPNLRSVVFRSAKETQLLRTKRRHSSDAFAKSSAIARQPETSGFASLRSVQPRPPDAWPFAIEFSYGQFFTPVRLIAEANLWLFAILQRQHGHCGAGVADEVVVVLEQRSRVPASAFALIGLEPCHTVAYDGV